MNAAVQRGAVHLCTSVKEGLNCQDLNYGQREVKQLHYQRTQNSINISRVGTQREIYKLPHTSSLRL